jgi:hypothetical protein
MQGFLELITLMLAMSGLGVDSNSKAPSADVVLAYTVEDADVVAYLDVVAVGPRNHKVIVGLPDDPMVKESPEALALAKKLKSNVEGVRGMAKAVAGLDPVNDITSVTVFVDFVPGKEPLQMAVARGTFPADFLKKVASVAGGTTGSIDGRATLELDANRFFGTSKDGALLVGPRAWVEPRVDDDWKSPKRKKGSDWAAIAKRLDAKPFLLVAAKLDDTTAAALGKDLTEPFAKDLVAGAELAIVALHGDGVSFHWKDRTKAGLERVALAAEGMVDLTRAAHVAPRGVAKIAVAALGSYAGLGKEVDAVIARKADLLKIIEEYTGDGKFKVAVDKDAKARTLTVRATGKHLSDVVPAAVFVPAAAFLFVMGEDAAAPPQSKPPATTKPKPKPVPPRKDGGIRPKAKKTP